MPPGRLAFGSAPALSSATSVQWSFFISGLYRIEVPLFEFMGSAPSLSRRQTFASSPFQAARYSSTFLSALKKREMPISAPIYSVVLNTASQSGLAHFGSASMPAYFALPSLAAILLDLPRASSRFTASWY